MKITLNLTPKMKLYLIREVEKKVYQPIGA